MPDQFAAPSHASVAPSLIDAGRAPAGRPVAARADVGSQGPRRAPDIAAAGAPSPAPSSPQPKPRRATSILAFISVAAPSLLLRVYELNALGFNSDEAVYAGQAASIAGQEAFLDAFPIFRAHPLLFQSVLSMFYWESVSDLTGRLLAVCFGLGAVWLTYLIGRELYDRRVGYVAALLLGLMPYHVIVSRQVLLDGPMTFFATLTLYLLVRHSLTGRVMYLYAGAGAMGLTVLCKEPAVLLLGAIYAYYSLTRVGHLKFRQIAAACGVFALTILPFPLSIRFSGRSSTGEQFLSYQIFRRPNHSWNFYFVEVPPMMGILVVAAAIAGMVFLWRHRSWREALLCCWILVPFAFFELWPVKGFQYLLPLAPAIVVLAARAVVLGVDNVKELAPDRRHLLTAVLVGVLVLSLAVPSWRRIQPGSSGASFLAGGGGVPGGREAGEWVAQNVPEGSKMLAVGPSMANIVQFYGHRKTYGLSVSPNPLHRNPVYEPVINPDNLIRQGEVQYLIWDAYSANRTQFFTQKLLAYAERYHGRIVHTESVASTGTDGRRVETPVIVIYEVRS